MQNEYTIEIQGLKSGDLTKVALVLMAANIREADDVVSGAKYLFENMPKSVTVHKDDVARAVSLILALGFEVEEQSYEEALQSRIMHLERGIKVAVHNLEKEGAEWGWAEDPEFTEIVKRLKALIK